VRVTICITFLLLLAASCGKKKAKTPPDDTYVPVVSKDTGFKCAELPPPSSTFGWADTTTDENKNVNAFFRNPVNADEVVFVVNGDMYGFNKMYSLHIPSRRMTFHGNLGPYLPQINKYGWIVYSNSENNIFKVKTNGDSLTQLTSQKISHDPKWDYTGNFIYYFQEAHFNVPTQLIKINSKGINVSGLPIEMQYTAVFKQSDKIIFLRTRDNTVTLVQRDMSNYIEKDLISGPYQPRSPLFFDNLTLDNNDQNIYWSNKDGIFKCSLTDLKTQILFKNCDNQKYINPIISYKTNELSFSWHTIKPINQFQLLHQYKTMEYNLVTNELTELKIFQ
jgi:hypothetical protein